MTVWQLGVDGMSLASSSDGPPNNWQYFSVLHRLQLGKRDVRRHPNVRAEEITAIQTESGTKIKMAVGRGVYVKDKYVRRMTMHTMKWAFLMTGNYDSNADNNYDPKALPEISGIHYRDIVAEDVSIAALLQGISSDPFTGICISNVTIKMEARAKKNSWSFKNVEGMTSRVTPRPCHLLPDQKPEQLSACNFPEENLPIHKLKLKKCFNSAKHA